MALLAELSIMDHELPDTSDAVDAWWEREYLNQLAIVRARFAGDERVAQILKLIFDPAHEAAQRGLAASRGEAAPCRLRHVPLEAALTVKRASEPAIYYARTRR